MWGEERGSVRRQPSVSDMSTAFRGASIIFNASVLLDRGGDISRFGLVWKADDLKYSAALTNVPECPRGHTEVGFFLQSLR